MTTAPAPPATLARSDLKLIYDKHFPDGEATAESNLYEMLAAFNLQNPHPEEMSDFVCRYINLRQFFKEFSRALETGVVID